MSNTPSPDTSASTFGAFISYSHADAKRVRRLHSQIEAYRLPNGLRQIGATSNKPAGLGKVFLDRSDLPASENLSAAVLDALKRSEALIVVCSPSARNSRWIAEEIKHFRAHRPDKPILAAVIEGEPSEVFPPLLLEEGAEPLAADFRKEGDGPRLALLKLISGAAGVPLDTLIQRDGQRKVRRVTAITGVAMLVTLVQAVMTVIALDARDEAQFQQAKAEDLIEFMLTDLRSGLEGVGRLELMENVNERAIDYYDSQGDPGDLSDDSLMRRARVIDLIGVDNDKRENFEDARANFAQRISITQELRDREPDNPERVLAHVSAIARAMTSPSSQLSSEEMNAHANAVLGGLDLIREWGKTDPEWLELEAVANSNRCAIGLQEADFSEAVESHCVRSAEASKGVADLGTISDAKYIAAYNIYWYALWLEGSGDRLASEEQFASAIAYSNDLVRSEPENRKFLRQKMELLGSTPASHADFMTNVCQASTIARELTAYDPADANLRNRSQSYIDKLGGNHVNCL